jgi:hypothetical protein
LQQGVHNRKLVGRAELQLQHFALSRMHLMSHLSNRVQGRLVSAVLNAAMATAGTGAPVAGCACCMVEASSSGCCWSPGDCRSCTCGCWCAPSLMALLCVVAATGPSSCRLPTWRCCLQVRLAAAGSVAFPVAVAAALLAVIAWWAGAAATAGCVRARLS